MIYKLLLICFLPFLCSCKKNVKNKADVYNNDFEAGKLTDIQHAQLVQFNSSTMLGTYKSGGFILQLNNLPTHDLLTISFDLYIHGTWDGNVAAPDGPDIWQMLVDEKPYINASFSNAYCAAGTFCPPQSYPNNYPNNNNNPKTGAAIKALPGICQLNDSTSMYRIEKTINHSSHTLILQCISKLVEANTNDNTCGESWSVDNISIKSTAL